MIWLVSLFSISISIWEVDANCFQLPRLNYETCHCACAELFRWQTVESALKDQRRTNAIKHLHYVPTPTQTVCTTKSLQYFNTEIHKTRWTVSSKPSRALNQERTFPMKESCVCLCCQNYMLHRLQKVQQIKE